MKKISCIFLLAFLVAAYWGILLSGPEVIRHLFDQGRMDLLDRLMASSSPQSLDFYLGRGEEILWGPMAQVVAGLILVGLALGPWRAVSAGRFFLMILGFLVITKWNVLWFPPYGDSIGGPFAEGLWLAQNNFNYAGLFQQPGYAQGGPKVYFFSAFPTYLAIMMKVIPSVKPFLVVNHLVFFAMAAGIGMFVREIGRRIFSLKVAGLLAVLVLSWPVVQSQVEAINMELPCLFFAVAASWAIVRGRIHLAGGMALAAVLMKGVGVFACAAFLLCGLCSLAGEKDAAKRRAWLVWGVSLFVMAVFIVAVKFLTKDQHVTTGQIRLWAGWASLKTFPITYVFILNLLVFAFLGWRERWGRAVTLPGDITRRDDWKVVGIQVAFAAMWFLLFLNFNNVSPRYRIAVYPFFLFSLVWIYIRCVPWRGLQAGALAVAVLVVQFHAYGLRHAPMLTEDYVLLEENLQYRNDLVMYQKVARLMEQKYAGMTIVAPFIMAQALAVPWFGYVDKARDVVIYGFNCTYGGIRAYPGMQGLDLSRTIYVAITIDRAGGDFPYPIHPQDKVLETVEWGNKKAWIFMGGVSIDMMKKFQEYMILRRQQVMRRHDPARPLSGAPGSVSMI